MAVCTFIGNKKVYDRGLYKRLVETIIGLAQQDEEVEILFGAHIWPSDAFDSFYNLSLIAALDAKTLLSKKNKDKKVIITWLVTQPAYADFIQQLKQGKTDMPACMIDKVAIMPAPLSSKRQGRGGVKVDPLDRWRIQQCTHIISYLYRDLFSNNELYEYAQKLGVPVLDITTAATAEIIQAGYSALTTQERTILEERKAGHSWRRISDLIGKSVSGVQWTGQQALKKIRAEAIKNTRTAEKSRDASEKEPVCSIFLLEPANYERMCLFKHCVRFLIDKYGVSQFRIMENICVSAYMYVLKEFFGRTEITVVTNYPEMSGEDWEKVKAQYIPPCHAVENIMTEKKSIYQEVTGILEYMIQDAEFYICDLSGNSDADGFIKGCIANTSAVMLFNIGERYREA
ncbi:hypothetical protein RX717_08685 [Intestinibacillus sp. NTUH-41-i26]|uniref:hypothetical protein n=1 Tax=Butyricicoccaceae TaxID=3085642 RepID=UPI00131C9298|nr:MULTISPECIES: hypothetical protein [Butyricicoccaceae]WOC74104.1 hypothetical protein RX717_08685 [Intestinibacillus sp. NTUH-41-i26]